MKGWTRDLGEPYPLAVLIAAIAWTTTHLVTDDASGAAFRAFLIGAVLLGCLVGWSERPSRLLPAVLAIVVVPSIVTPVDMGDARWTWLDLGMTVTSLLIAYAITGATRTLTRAIDRSSRSRTTLGDEA